MRFRRKRRQSKKIPNLKKIVILTEGETEDAYFGRIKELYKDSIILRIVRRNGNSATQLVKQMEVKLENGGKYELVDDDEAWIVFDHDNRPHTDFMTLVNWKNNSPRYGIAVSNLDFEYWKLLHFHPGTKLTSRDAYHKKLAQLLKIDVDDIKNQRIGRNLLGKFNEDNIKEAITRAKNRAKSLNQNGNWPENGFNSFVYKLVDKIV